MLHLAEHTISNRNNSQVQRGDIGQSDESTETALRNEILAGDPANVIPDTHAFCRMIKGMAQILDEQLADDAANNSTDRYEAQRRVYAAARAARAARASIGRSQEVGEAPPVHHKEADTGANVTGIDTAVGKVQHKGEPAANGYISETPAQGQANDMQGNQSTHVQQVRSPQVEVSNFPSSAGPGHGDGTQDNQASSQADLDEAPAEHCPQAADAAGIKEVGTRYGNLISQAARFPAAMAGMVAGAIGQTIRGTKSEGKRSRANIEIYEQRAASEAHLPHHGYAPPFENEKEQAVVAVAA